MLDPTFVASLAQTIAKEILAPAIRHTDDVTHIHVLQDALQKIRHPRYSSHPDFATGYTFGQSYSRTHEHPCAFTLAESTPEIAKKEASNRAARMRLRDDIARRNSVCFCAACLRRFDRSD